MGRRPIHPRPSEVIQEIVQDTVDRAVEAILDIILRNQRAAEATHPRGTGRRGKGTKPARSEITVWKADINARRVPLFVIDATGLDTKKKIVERFGANALFKKGEPLPVTLSSFEVVAPKRRGRPPKRPMAEEPVAKPERHARARPPILRKRAAVA